MRAGDKSSVTYHVVVLRVPHHKVRIRGISATISQTLPGEALGSDSAFGSEILVIQACKLIKRMSAGMDP